MAGRKSLFRNRGVHDHSPVTYIELFFDLVFVFAITQLSHHLVAHLGPAGALETLLMLFAVWWVWIYTSWTTNWLDPESGQVRLMLIVMMVMGLALSSAIPNAFGATGWLFAAAYWSMQMLRTLYMVGASWRTHRQRARNFLRISFWFLLSAPFWAAGALVADHTQRLILWGTALAVEYAGPTVFFVTPGLGRSRGEDWDISGGHMAERCALFIIIALGEAVLVTGATFAGLPQDALHWSAFLTSFLGSAALWWIYFDIGARRGAERMATADNAGLIARNAYTYLHIPIVAGIVISAVADEMMLSHPDGQSSTAFLIVAIGGAAVFLLGNQMFKWITSDLRLPPFSHFIGLLLLFAVAGAALVWHWTPLGVGQAVTGVLILTAVWEWLSLNGGWQRWAPWIGPLFGADVVRADDDGAAR